MARPYNINPAVLSARNRVRGLQGKRAQDDPALLDARHELEILKAETYLAEVVAHSTAEDLIRLRAVLDRCAS
jgi:hypothetical protein